jgi:hypothetical protein
MGWDLLIADPELLARNKSGAATRLRDNIQTLMKAGRDNPRDSAREALESMR